MLTRVDRELWEERTLHPSAALSSRCAGRLRPEPQDDLRTVYQRDRDRIVHSDAFRRLSHKTQVFIAPDNDHYRTRLTHTLEVAQISRTIARSLRLNEDLVEAIALGHDLGHTPFGHAGEDALDACLARRSGVRDPRVSGDSFFCHNEQSLRVVDCLEGMGKGLNLTLEVRDGILNHTGCVPASTFEGRIVATADRIAYVNHDIDDAIRAGLITEEDLPRGAVKALGDRRSQRIDTMVRDMVEESERTGDIAMSEGVWCSMMELRSFLESTVYARADEEQNARAFEVVTGLFEHYMAHPEQVAQPYRSLSAGDDVLAVVDCIASMSDRYALSAFEGLR